MFFSYVFDIYIYMCGCLCPCISNIYSLYIVSMLENWCACTICLCVCPCAMCALTSSCLNARHVERYHQGSGEDSEARDHVPGGFPGGGSDHEETPP